MSLLFYVGKRRQKPLRLQRYEEILIYANKFAKKCTRRIFLYGRSYVPHGSFRSDCQVKAILHGKTDEAAEE